MHQMAIMVARGDLGGLKSVMLVCQMQKALSHRPKHLGKPVITATK